MVMHWVVNVTAVTLLVVELHVMVKRLLIFAGVRRRPARARRFHHAPGCGGQARVPCGCRSRARREPGATDSEGGRSSSAPWTGSSPRWRSSADTLSARGVLLGGRGGHVARCSLRPRGPVISGADRSVLTGGGRGSAAMTAEGLEEAARSAGQDVEIDFAAGGIVVSSESLGQAAGTPTVSAGH